MKKKIFFVLLVIAIAAISVPVYAVTVEQVEKSAQEIEKERQLRERIEKKAEKPVIQEQMPAEIVPPATGEKVLVREIVVAGVSLLSQEEINKITAPYKGKEVSLRDMQKVADLITDAYRQKGYITSRAYLPPQQIRDARLTITVVEGATGDIDVKGNRYFRAYTYEKQIALKNGQPFDYEVLRKGLSRINEQPDRNVKAVLSPGRVPGSTDVVLNAEDKWPLHIGFDYDNFGSPYIGYDRFKLTLTDNNLSAVGDILALQCQESEGEDYRLFTLRYILPVTNSMDLGFFAADSKLELQKEFEDSNTRGKSRYYSLYAVQNLIKEDNTNLNLNLGFDYKDIFNFANNLEASRDRMRVIKLGFDWDRTDNYGRTLVTAEANYGIDGIMGGLEKRDAHASRAGSGGRFHKEILNILRLNKMPFDSMMLWKNQFQFSPYILTGAEQFQIGGIVNVRGYPPAEVVGDRGYAMTWEWSFPVYFISKDINVPLSKAKLYDALKVVTFYDWANTRLRRPGEGEEENKTLRAAGCGLRFHLPEDFAARVECVWALDNKPSDGDNFRVLTSVSKSF